MGHKRTVSKLGMVPELRRQREEEFKVKASLGYIMKCCLKKAKNNVNKC
jgi:hypothetical protein